MSSRTDVIFEITPQLLLRAYSCGIFPMAEDADDPGIFWVEPEWRGILPLDGFHIPRSLKKAMRREPFEIRFNTAFAEVVAACAEATPDRPSTWINDRIRSLYNDLHRMGHAHSVEAWREGQLVGGLYGVSLGGAFFGESMFSRATDASKIALVHLVYQLRNAGFELLDTQFVTDHLTRFGTSEIYREAYQERLADAISLEADFKTGLNEETGTYSGAGTSDSILQSLSQMS